MFLPRHRRTGHDLPVLANIGSTEGNSNRLTGLQSTFAKLLDLQKTNARRFLNQDAARTREVYCRHVDRNRRRNIICRIHREIEAPAAILGALEPDVPNILLVFQLTSNHSSSSWNILTAEAGESIQEGATKNKDITSIILCHCVCTGIFGPRTILPDLTSQVLRRDATIVRSWPFGSWTTLQSLLRIIVLRVVISKVGQLGRPL
jgi:hypothetical protein